MIVTLVAALAENGVIGREGALPWRLPDDLAHFKALTLGKPVVMGRKTFDAIGKPLPGRANIVMTRSRAEIPGVTVVRSVEEAIAAANGAAELCVIGGAEIYAAFLPRADVLELTHVAAELEGDARFPPFDRAAFRIVSERSHPADERHVHPFRFVRYERVR